MGIFGVPDDVKMWIMKLYTDCTVQLKVGKIKGQIPYGCGVKQGDNLAPTLFIMVIQLAAQDLEKEFTIAGIDILKVLVSSSLDSTIRKHSNGDINNMSLTMLLMLLFMDDGAIPFNSRQDALIGIKIIKKVFNRFGLTIHSGFGKKKSKTKTVFFPSTKTIKRWRYNSNDFMLNSSDTSDYADVIDLRPNIPLNIDLLKIYKNAPETAPLVLDEITEEHVPFESSFCYLGTIIDFMLDDTSDISCRVSKANKAMGALSFIWDTSEVSLETKVSLFLAIPVNLALWNSETWSGNKVDLSMLDAFHHKAIRRILKIKMSEVKSEKINNLNLRKRFGNVKALSETWRHRLLKFVGRTIRQEKHSLSRLFLSVHIDNALLNGRPFRKNKDAIVESLRLLMPSLPESGPHSYWVGYARNELVWTEMIGNLFTKTYPDHANSESYPRTRSRDAPNQSNPPTVETPPNAPRSPPPNNTPASKNPRELPSPMFDLSIRKLTPQDARRILDVGKKASRREITLRYRILSRKYHPDKWSPDRAYSREISAEKFKFVSNARDVLLM